MKGSWMTYVRGVLLVAYREIKTKSPKSEALKLILKAIEIIERDEV